MRRVVFDTGGRDGPDEDPAQCAVSVENHSSVGHRHWDIRGPHEQRVMRPPAPANRQTSSLASHVYGRRAVVGAMHELPLRTSPNRGHHLMCRIRPGRGWGGGAALHESIAAFLILGARPSWPPAFSFAGWKPALPGGRGLCYSLVPCPKRLRLTPIGSSSI